jgi:hypothetical protein
MQKSHTAITQAPNVALWNGECAGLKASSDPELATSIARNPRTELPRLLQDEAAEQGSMVGAHSPYCKWIFTEVCGLL